MWFCCSSPSCWTLCLWLYAELKAVSLWASLTLACFVTPRNAAILEDVGSRRGIVSGDVGCPETVNIILSCGYRTYVPESLRLQSYISLVAPYLGRLLISWFPFKVQPSPLARTLVEHLLPDAASWVHHLGSKKERKHKLFESSPL